MIDKTDLQQLRDLASGVRKFEGTHLTLRDRATIFWLLENHANAQLAGGNLLRVAIRNIVEADEWRSIANRRLRDNIALNEVLIEFAYGKWWQFVFGFRRLRNLALEALNGN
jgi:hypothetical protein